MKSSGYIIKTILGLIYIVVIYFLLGYFGHSVINGRPEDVLLFSAMVALIINMFLAGFFETPRDVIASSLNVMILMAPYLKQENVWTNALFYYSIFCLIVSILAVALYDPEGSRTKNVISKYFKQIAENFGNSKLLFGLAIIGILISFYNNQNMIFYTISLGYVLIISSKEIQELLYNSIHFIWRLFNKQRLDIEQPVGRLVAVQSKDTFIIDLIDTKKRKQLLHLFDFVEFRHGAADNMFIRGFVIDRYALDSQQQIKVLMTTRDNKTIHSNNEYEDNMVYKISSDQVTPQDMAILNNFVGIVTERSDITKIRFEYSPNKILTNGSLLYVSVKANGNTDFESNYDKVLYQVTQAVTDIKQLEKGNETGLIVATATQLGVWRNEQRNFENYGWVPFVNSKVMIANDVTGPEPKNTEIELGTIENTSFKVIVDINSLITHHTAILGTTGTGKSVFSRNLIRQLSEKNTKIFCIDFTGDTKQHLDCVNVVDLAEEFDGVEIQILQKDYTYLNKNKSLSEHIRNYVEIQDAVFGKTPKEAKFLERDIKNFLKEKIKAFIADAGHNIGILEFSSLSNTVESLEYTKFFFMALFELAKAGTFKDIKLCLMLEEAHTLIPEWNSVAGADDKTARRLTNTIAQIALQGRKYNVGLLVIAQRTANVSKTILTQCNTIISFKQFDNTSRDFLINHFGEEFVKSLPSLKFRQAVIAGKALVSDMPIMFKVPNIDEASNINQTSPQQVVTETISLAEGTEGVIVPEETKIFHANTDFNIK